MENKVSATLSIESINMMKEAMLTFNRELPFLIELTAVESKRITRMESGRLDFVNKAFLIAKEFPNLCPSFFNIDEMNNDVNLCKSLDEITPMVEKLVKQINDTRSQAGHEAYNSALEVYSNIKRAALNGIPGAQNAYDELKLMFEGQGKVDKAEPSQPK